MLKDKKFAAKSFIVLFIAVLLIYVLRFAYINDRRSFYDSNREYKKNIAMSYDICGYDSYDCWGAGGHIIFIGIGLNSEKPAISVSNADPEHHIVKERGLNEFEVYLLCDMANYMLDLNERMDRKYTQKYAMYWDIYAYDDIPPHLSGQMISKCRDSFKANLFLLVSMTIFYKYIVLSLAVLYLIVLFCVYKCVRNIIRLTPGSGLLRQQSVFKLPTAKFTLLSLLTVLLYGLIYIPIFAKQISNKIQTAPFVPFEVTGTDIRVGLIYAVICLIFLFCVLKNDRSRICLSYILSTSIVLWYQYVYFKEKEFYIGGVNIVPAKSIKFDILLFSEAMPFYPQLFYFTLFFLLSLIIHYIMLIILRKDRCSQRFLWAVAFAVNNAVLTVMPGYVLQYVLRFV